MNKWKTLEDKEVGDLFEELKNAISKDHKIQIHVGSDSQQVYDHTEIATVVVLIREGKGGRAFYKREKHKRINSLRERLHKEVWDSVELSLDIQEAFPDLDNINIHIDVNPNVSFHSSSYIKELTGMVVGQGFGVTTKPDSWAASSVADRCVKHDMPEVRY